MERAIANWCLSQYKRDEIVTIMQWCEEEFKIETV